MKNKTVPYKVGILHRDVNKTIYWPTNSREGNKMVIGDGIPGDEDTAALCARCCNIAYGQALDDVEELLRESGIDGTRLLKKLR
jgi:hypothetical protein